MQQEKMASGQIDPVGGSRLLQRSPARVEPSDGVGVVPRANGLVEKSPADRNRDIDFVKGALVLLMVLYHWLNYFVTPQGEFYRFLRFLTSSFIMITGLLISNVYPVKYDLGDFRVYGRLLRRGFKLLLLFTALNLVVHAIVSRNYNGGELGLHVFLGHAWEIYVAGTGRAAVFEVLVPIAYLLIVSAPLLAASRASGIGLAMLAVIGFVATLTLSLTTGIGGNAALLGVGFLGMALGRAPSAALEKTLDRTIQLLIFYTVYLTGLMIWNVTYPVQVMGACANLWLLYWISRRCGPENRVVRCIIELGQYSLFAYIFHILVLQVLRAAVNRSSGGLTAVFVALGVTVAATVLAVKLIGAIRTRSAAANCVYKAVFA